MSRSGRRRRLNRSATPSRWADLPPDLLDDVSRRLHDAADFTRFHAVCTAWRDALPTPLYRRPAFIPWLLCTVPACDGPILHSSINSGRSCGGILLTNPPGSSNWLASMDGRAAWLLTTDTGAGLVDLLTGALTPLPASKLRQLENPRGVISSDGTIFLHGFTCESAHRLALMATFLRPGDTAWTRVKTVLNYSPGGRFYFSATAAYHDGNILVVCADLSYSCVLTPDNYRVSRKLELSRTWYDEGRCRANSYFVELQGQLLLASVMVNYHHDDPTQMFSLAVHGWEQDEMRWVERDAASLGDQALFLGSNASFAMDAARLGLDGRCAYFIFRHDVFRYDFVDGEVKLIDSLPPAWPANTVRDMHWLRTQPTISWIPEIRKRLHRAPVTTLAG